MRRGAVIISTATLVAVVSAVPALAGKRPAPHPQLGTYSGHIGTHAPGNKPGGFTMTVARGRCAPPGGGRRHAAYCVTVPATSLIQAPCPDFVDDEFFPVTEPIALPASRGFSHTYGLWSDGGQLSDRQSAGAQKVGSFQLSLGVGLHGAAKGSARIQVANCDSGVVKITAKRKAPRKRHG